MSRVQLIEQLYIKRKSALEFDYDNLWAPPIGLLFSQEDINELIRIATSLKYNADISKKYELIDAVMTKRGFKKAHSGTNRVVYNFLEDKRFVAKVAVDRVGMQDSPAEFKNQEFFKPFCCKIFEVHSSGVIAFVERVNPITSLEEFASVADDIFNMMVTKIIGKYVVDDLGTDKYMNYGLRYNANGYTFGPVVIDFPYAYEVDGAKLICTKPIDAPYGPKPCNGEIDYDAGFNNLVCTKCGRTYKAIDLKKNNSDMILMYSDNVKGAIAKMRSRIISGGEVVIDSGFSSDKNITPEEYTNLPQFPSKNATGKHPVVKTVFVKGTRGKQIRKQQREDLLSQHYEKMKAHGVFNPVIDTRSKASRATKAEVKTKFTPVPEEPTTIPVGKYIKKPAKTVKVGTPIEEIKKQEIPTELIEEDIDDVLEDIGQSEDVTHEGPPTEGEQAVIDEMNEVISNMPDKAPVDDESVVNWTAQEPYVEEQVQEEETPEIVEEEEVVMDTEPEDNSAIDDYEEYYDDDYNDRRHDRDIRNKRRQQRKNKRRPDDFIDMDEY